MAAPAPGKIFDMALVPAPTKLSKANFLKRTKVKHMLKLENPGALVPVYVL
jgi:hypothetical protein